MTSVVTGSNPTAVNNQLLNLATPITCYFDASTIIPGKPDQDMYRVPLCNNSYLIGASVWSQRAKTGSAQIILPTLTFGIDGSGPQIQLATTYPELSNNFTIFVNSTNDYWPGDPRVYVTLYIAHQQVINGQ